MSHLHKKQAMQECLIHSQLSHENIIELYNYTETEAEYILLMEYADKENFLSEKIENETSPIKNEEKLRSYAEDLLNALDYVHRAGIIHCDIKLENTLL